MNNVHQEAPMSLLPPTRKTFLLAAGLALSLAAAAGDPSNLSRSSELSANGSTTVVEGSLVAVEGSAEATVTAVQAVGDALWITLQGSATVGRFVLAVPLAVAGGASYAVGQTPMVVAQGVGWLIVRGGEVIAFIPNEAGKALLHSQPVRDLRR